MAGTRRGLTQRQIRTLFDVGPVAGLSDGQLLERFATRADEGAELAFAALVERHGPMVLHICRGIVRDDHEAMDVFQATFLVLARKGGTLWVRDSLGPWLHRVACRAAGRARNAAARRRKIETREAAMADPRSSRGGGGGGDADREELAAVIHDEVNRLPERYRSPVVLCDLEGCTCEEAARHLGCPVGTVASRLARARQRLRDRLRRRGLAPDTSLIAAAMRWQGPGGASISAELAGSTARAAVQFVSLGAVAHGAASSLALEVLKTMSMTHWWKVASLLLVMSASASGVVAFAGKDAASGDPVPDDPPKAIGAAEAPGLEVKPGRLQLNVKERGTLEPSKSVDVFCLVEDRATILSIVPEGTRVKKGDIVCELDSAALRDTLTNQSISMSGAEAAYKEAKLDREFAERGLKEYEEQIYPRELQLAQGEIAMAQSAITLAEDKLKRTRTASERLKTLLVEQGGAKTSADVIASLDLDDRLDDAQLILNRERRALEIGLAKRDLLEKSTKEKTIRQLRTAVQTAQAREKGEQSRWEREQAKAKSLERQIASCRMLAPSDGLVVYANEPSRFGGGNQPQIEEGAVVRERQKIFSLPDTGHMQVNTKVHESIVDRLTPGLRALIRVDAFADQSFAGVVENVAPLPDPKTPFDAGFKVYSTRVPITKSIPGLRPGMTASVDITVVDLENVLSVPVQAVVRYDGNDHVAVKTAEGGIDWRVVTLGLSDGHHVEVKEGLKRGETIVPEPGPLLSEEQKQMISLTPHRPAARFNANTIRSANGNRYLVIPALWAKFQALSLEDRQKVRDANPTDRQSMLKTFGFTDLEIRQLNSSLPTADTPR